MQAHEQQREVASPHRLDDDEDDERMMRMRMRMRMIDAILMTIDAMCGAGVVHMLLPIRDAMCSTDLET
eukprot:3235166-Rhodomonas_salina.4